MQKIKSIISSGTQYIDTGFVPDTNTKVVMDFRLAVSPGTSNFALFAVEGQFSFRYYGTNSAFRSNGGNNVDFDTTIDALARHTVVKTSIMTAIDNQHTVSTTAGTVSLSLYLLAQHKADGVSNYAKAELYSCQIYDNETLVRDYVPCLDDSGVVCLYDLVESKYYYNAGTGSFTVGYPPVMFKRRPLIELAHEAAVTITGTGQTSRCYVTIGGTKYTAATTGLSVMTGDTITCTVNIPSGVGTAGSTVTLNGTTIFTSSSGSASGGGFPGSTSSTTSSYPWVVPKGTKTISIALTAGSSSSKASSIAITTT